LKRPLITFVDNSVSSLSSFSSCGVNGRECENSSCLFFGKGFKVSGDVVFSEKSFCFLSAMFSLKPPDDFIQRVPDMCPSENPALDFTVFLGNRLPEFNLWLSVFMLALKDLTNSPLDETANYFVFENNEFFGLLCQVLNIYPDDLRLMVRCFLRDPKQRKPYLSAFLHAA